MGRPDGHVSFLRLHSYQVLTKVRANEVDENIEFHCEQRLRLHLKARLRGSSSLNKSLYMCTEF